MHLPNLLFASYLWGIHEIFMNLTLQKHKIFLHEEFMKNSYILDETIFMKFQEY